MISMSKDRFRGLMIRKGTAHARNYICKKSFKARQEPETLEAQIRTQTPHQMQPESRYPETNFAWNKTAASFKPARASFSDQREKWMAAAKEVQLKAILAAKGSAARATCPPGSRCKAKGNQNQSPPGGFGYSGKSNWQQQQQHPPQKKPNGNNEIISSSRMQKQARLVKELQQLSRINSKALASSAPTAGTSLIANKLAAEPENAQKKSRERLAYLKAIQQLNSYHAFDPVPGLGMCLPADRIMEHTPERIPVIQITGSKGRATTSGLVQHILLSHGIRTGLLCSPHLFSSYEGIRIDGEPLSEVRFTKLFWKIHSRLDKMQPPPAYNQLLTLMAFHAFRQANVDVAIVELGSGGTNITAQAGTIGLNSLGSLPDIACAKAAATIYTNVSPAECCEMGVKLHRVPTFSALTDANPCHKRLLSRANNCVKLNGPLGIQLAYDYLRRHRPELVVEWGDTTQLSPGALRGIETFQPAGHFDVIKHDILNVHLDPADSVESMMACREWFHSRTRATRSPKLLLYSRANAKDINAKDLLTILRCNVRFDEACFVPCPNFFEGEFVAEEQSTAMVWHDKAELHRAKRNARSWRHLCEECGKKDTSHLTISLSSFFDHVLNKYGQQKSGTRTEVDILVTGSRQLVAAAIAILNKMRGSTHKRC
ncbi:folylpolyglutamate synthase, mitochondrial-like [Drosophila obscura]|uniref:folylpolyglutamate synthase, mitochondrial-like n=1 Tax=Drosophila obscura TaxID=7282 RepID=UPI001BB172B3|nr:folylpolyglutamate synthase, mitochondrial-like [Drosophila obscura]